MDHEAQGLKGRRVIVTGAAGFVGRHVMAAVEQVGGVPIGLVRGAPSMRLDAIDNHVCADLVHDPLDQMLDDLRPDAIIHCAGRTFSADSDDGRARLFADNLTGTAQLVSAVARMAQPVRLVIVSSAAIWAPMPAGLFAIDETHPMRPVAAYGVSKTAATLLALAEADRLGLDLAVGVPFNVIGPGQPRRLVPQVFIDQLRSNPGSFDLNASVVRDWIDVRDVASALVLLAHPGSPQGLFNIATGRGLDLKDMLLALCRVGNWQPEIRNAAENASAGVSRSIGDARRLHTVTGWLPRVPLDDSLRDMIFPVSP